MSYAQGRPAQPGAVHVLTAALAGFALIGTPSRLPDHYKAAMELQGCLPDGSGFVRVVLSGAVEYSIDWNNETMECGGFNGVIQIGGVPAGAGSQIDLMFDIDVEEGSTGTGLPARVAINDRATERHFQTSEAGGCTVDVTEQSLVDENPAFRTYKLAANGRCTKTSLQYSGPGGAGASEITVGDFEFVGLAVWQGPREGFELAAVPDD